MPDTETILAFPVNRAGQALPATRPSHLPIYVLPHISLHFEADLQFDITGNAVHVVFLVALSFCAESKLCPFGLKFLARLHLIGHAPIQLLLRAGFELDSRAISNFGTASAIGVGCREVRIMIGR
jgi:hypothetical protein